MGHTAPFTIALPTAAFESPEDWKLVCLSKSEFYALKELPQPQVDFTFGLLNLNPDPSRLST